MSIIDQVQEGLASLDRHQMSDDTARTVAREVYRDDLNNFDALLVAANAVLNWDETSDHTEDGIARWLCDQSGAYPWDGPVGNGFTLPAYRARFREIARQYLLFWSRVGLSLEEAGR